MSHFPIRRYRLFDDPFDRFFGDQLDFFDPWRDFETFPTALAIQPNAFRWINEPRHITRSSSSSYHSTSSNANSGNTIIPVTTSITPVLSEKFRVQLNVAGFNPETIQTKVEQGKIIVEAKQEDRQADGDYHIRQLRKSYPLPEHAGK